MTKKALSFDESLCSADSISHAGDWQAAPGGGHALGGGAGRKDSIARLFEEKEDASAKFFETREDSVTKLFKKDFAAQYAREVNRPNACQHTSAHTSACVSASKGQQQGGESLGDKESRYVNHFMDGSSNAATAAEDAEAEAARSGDVDARWLAGSIPMKTRKKIKNIL